MQSQFKVVHFPASYLNLTSLVVQWSRFLTTKHEVPCSIPGSNMGIFPGRGRSPFCPWSGQLLNLYLRAHPGTSSSHISPLTSQGQRSHSSSVSQSQKSASLQPQTGGKTTKFIRTRGDIGEKKYISLQDYYFVLSCLLSTQEAVNNGVPLVGIPVHGEQKLNMLRTVSAGMGILLDFRNVTTDSLTWAITKVIENPRYLETN